tara:strand:- start:21299 stop:22282 length:984 start_codon:yes stop_codon:yes gene_type:complete
MRAIEISKPGGPEVLTLCERPIPDALDGQVVLRIAYAGVNRPDAMQRAGMYDPPPSASDLPGLEASGVIVQRGAGVTRWSVGEHVCALLPGGGYAEYAATNALHCLPIPQGMQMKSAACLPETFFTVWSNVFMRGGLKSGETFLVHGGSSGIGTTAIQLAKAFGATVLTTAGTDEKCQACIDLGADQVVNYKQQDFVEAFEQAGGVDVILDMVGGDYTAKNLGLLREEGRLIQIACQQGAKVKLNLFQLMRRRLKLTGSTLRPQSDAAKAAIADELFEHVWPLLDSGKISPVMDQTFDLSDASEAHERLEAGQHIGKVVLNVGDIDG